MTDPTGGPGSGGSELRWGGLTSHYCDAYDEMVDGAMAALEHQLVNIRHLQHHAAQLADRLRNDAGLGVGWVGSLPTQG